MGGKRISPVDPGIVDESRAATDLVLDLLGNLPSTIALSDIERETVAFAARAINCLGGLGRRIAINVEGDDLRAFSCIAQGNGVTDTRPTAGYHCQVSFEQACHGSSSHQSAH